MKSVIITTVAIIFLFVPLTAFAESQADGVILVKIFGDEFDFSHFTYQEKSIDIRFEGGNGEIIHRYSVDATIGDLFDSMGMSFDDECYVFKDNRQFCTNYDYSLKLFVNGEQTPSLKDYVIKNNDRILISYGDHNESINTISFQLSELNNIVVTKGDSSIPVQESQNTETKYKSGYTKLIIKSDTYWSAQILDGNQASSSYDGFGNSEFDIPCGKINIISLSLQKQTDYGFIDIKLLQNGKILNQAKTTAQYGIASVASECLSEFGGGCLIATATYGSELAPEVQKLRELRDNSLLATESGTNFMGIFNNAYYSFSPIIADYERENPVFKEMVKLTITPMLSSLSIMQYAESDSEVLGIGISVILLNIGMYFVAPAIVIVKLKQRL